MQNNELNLSNIQGYLPKSNYIEYNNNHHKYAILDLSSHILKLASKSFNEVCKLIGPDVKADAPFKSICAILLIDGSCYISNIRKIINFYILCSYAVAFHLLEINYGIAVVADGKFKIIIKQFEEPHSFEILERVYECLKIRRFRDNLSNDVYATQEYSIKLVQIPLISNTNRGDLAIQFLNWDKLNENEKQEVEKLTAIVKSKNVFRDMSNVAKLMPGEVTKKVKEKMVFYLE